MAIFHLTVKVVSRSAGRSAVASAAYRATDKLFDERQGKTFNYTTKTDNWHSQILLPPSAPDRLADRQTLWNAVEHSEVRINSRVARDLEFALPRELSDAENIELARSFVQEVFVNRGMCADLNLHRGKEANGQSQPHAHVMVTTRRVSQFGFGAKERSWDSKLFVTEAREQWASRVNDALARAGHAERVDHRSFEDRGLDLKPQPKMGPTGVGRPYSVEVRQHNTAKMIRDPSVLLEAITEHQSTFSRRDLARFVSRHTASTADFATVMAKVEAHPDLLRLGQRVNDAGVPDGQGERYSTRAMRLVEQRLAAAARELADTSWHGVHRAHVRVGEDLAKMGPEQREALRHLVDNKDLKLLVGYAGTGKTKLLGAAREAWEHAGCRVRGATLSGIAADGLQGGSGIESRTIASWEYAWARGREKLERKDVLVIDEAGMVGSRQMGRVLAAAAAAGAKVVMVGDGEQLQAVDAGGPFKTLVRRHGSATLTMVRRQRSRWQQTATQELATGRTGAAVARYENAGMVNGADCREAAAEQLVERWARDREARPESSQILLAYTRKDVLDLNDRARGKVKEAGGLTGGRVVQTERGRREMAVGDRLIFLRNDRELGVKNGTLGTVTEVGRTSLTVELDRHNRGEDAIEVKVDLNRYGHVDHGYAATIHKSQGVTVRQAYVLASTHFDRHAAYVALSRHQSRIDLAYGRDEFKDTASLTRMLSRPRAKDTTLDYGKAEPFRADLGAVRNTIREIATRVNEWPGIAETSRGENP